MVDRWNTRARCMIAALAVAVLTGATTPVASAEESTYTLFEDPKGSDLKPEALQQLVNAIRNAQAPGRCALGKLRIRTPSTDDPMFREAVASARRDNVLRTLDQLGLNVAGRLLVESTVGPNERGFNARYEAARDDRTPQLRTGFEPATGRRVKAGRTIRVTMTARDDPAPWPTGLKTIQLVADSDNGRVIASETFAPCAEPAERRVVATYAVPDKYSIVVKPVPLL